MNETRIEEVYELNGRYVFLDKTPLTDYEMEHAFVENDACYTLRGVAHARNRASVGELLTTAVLFPINLLTCPISFLLYGDPTGLL